MYRHASDGSSVGRSSADRGFSLVELMAVVAIIAILASVAIPSYRDYVIRGALTDAMSNLATKRIQNEQWYQDSRTYVGSTGCIPDTTTSKLFEFSCSIQTATSYTLQAIGKGNAAGFTFTLNQSNSMATPAVPTGTGWSTSNNCWTKRKGTDPC